MQRRWEWSNLKWEREEMATDIVKLYLPTLVTLEERDSFFLPVSLGNNCDGSGLSHALMSWPIAVVRGMGYSDCLNLGDVHTPEARESEVLFGGPTGFGVAFKKIRCKVLHKGGHGLSILI